MPKPTSTQPRAIRAFRATSVALGCLLTANLLLPFGCSPSDKGRDPGTRQPVDDSRMMVERDISPWDGPAFTLWIPADRFGGKPDSWIHLRIWSAPEESEGTFVFPDQTMKRGAVRYFVDLKAPHAVDPSRQPHQELKGWVRFIEANRGQPVVGEFDFVSEDAAVLKGRFQAQWRNEGWVERAGQGEAADSR